MRVLESLVPAPRSIEAEPKCIEVGPETLVSSSSQAFTYQGSSVRDSSLNVRDISTGTMVPHLAFVDSSLTLMDSSLGVEDLGMVFMDLSRGTKELSPAFVNSG